MPDNLRHPHLVSLPSDRIVPMPELFRHASTLHGQAHVTRVMVHAIHLVEATGQCELGPRLWAAVFLHDLARQHDGVCYRHGADAAQRLREELALQRRLADAGLMEVDYPAIEAAVTAHSARKEAARERDDPVCAGTVRPYRRRGGYGRDALSAGVGALTSFA